MILFTRNLRLAEEVWGICAYFNPVGYRRRLANYREFRRHLAVPLVTVEMSHDGRYELGPDDADVLIQCSAADVLWQRERMLNLALAAVPPGCNKIARLDCDVVFENPDWPRLASRLLDDFPLIQLFDEAFDQPPDCLPGQPAFPDRSRVWEGFASQWATSRDPRTLDRRSQASGTRSTSAMGLAWAFRRDLHQDIGMYDACVLGGAEHAILCAACGVADMVASYQQMSPARNRHYFDWATPFQPLIAGQLGFVPGRIAHLWHGDVEHRGYKTRYARFQDFDFDPARDLQLAESGMWQWATEKVEMHAYVRDYFASRREDG
jgi:hypothetical protein